MATSVKYNKDRDAYILLGVEVSASEDVIKRAYRKLAREHHPDIHSGEPSIDQTFHEEILKETNNAFDNLSADRRNQYNNQRFFEGGPNPKLSTFDALQATIYDEAKLKVESAERKAAKLLQEQRLAAERKKFLDEQRRLAAEKAAAAAAMLAAKVLADAQRRAERLANEARQKAEQEKSSAAQAVEDVKRANQIKEKTIIDITQDDIEFLIAFATTFPKGSNERLMNCNFIAMALKVEPGLYSPKIETQILLLLLQDKQVELGALGKWYRVDRLQILKPKVEEQKSFASFFRVLLKENAKNANSQNIKKKFVFEGGHNVNEKNFKLKP